MQLNICVVQMDMKCCLLHSLISLMTSVGCSLVGRECMLCMRLVMAIPRYSHPLQHFSRDLSVNGPHNIFYPRTLMLLLLSLGNFYLQMHSMHCTHIQIVLYSCSIYETSFNYLVKESNNNSPGS